MINKAHEPSNQLPITVIQEMMETLCRGGAGGEAPLHICVGGVSGPQTVISMQVRPGLTRRTPITALLIHPRVFCEVDNGFLYHPLVRRRAEGWLGFIYFSFES